VSEASFSNPTISFIAYQDAKPNGGRAVTRTRRGDSYMDDPRSMLESNQIFSIKRRSSNLCGRQAGHAQTPLNENMYPYVDIFYFVLDRAQLDPTQLDPTHDARGREFSQSGNAL
jgi:hypothetical protein